MNQLATIFDTGPFMPHGHCYYWTKSLVSLHAVSDILITLAYYSIPLTLIFFLRKRRDLQFDWMVLCFAVFILACGTTHLMEVWNIWNANYWVSGGVKAVTAMASVPTAILLIRLVPRVLALPSHAELKRMNNELRLEIAERRKAEKQFLDLLESAPDAMLIANSEGRIERVNLQTERLFGHSRSDLLGRPLEMLMPERFRSRHPGLREGYFANPQTRPMGTGLELFALRSDGSEFPVAISLSPTQSGGERRVIAAIRDITDQQQAQKAIEQMNETLEHRVEERTEELQAANVRLATEVRQRKEAERQVQKLNVELEERVRDRTAELEAVNRELESFSYSVSHDLRAPLRGIDGYIRMIEDEYADRLDSEGSRMLGVVSGEARRMGRLIDDLLGFSRLGRQAMNRGNVDMNRLVQDVMEEVNRTTSGNMPQFNVQTLPAVEGDASMLRQVFANLIGNAVKFSRESDSPSVEVSCEQRNSEVVFCVKDNGAGFDEQFGHKLFGVFQRLHREDEFEGTGVGLALVKRIVQRHGGRVWAEGKVNQGAAFYFALPTRKEDA